HALPGPVLGERAQRPAPRHQLPRGWGERSEGVAAHQHRLGKIVRRRVQVAPGQLILVGEGNGVDEEIERAPFRFNRRESRVDSIRFGYVAVADHQPADLLRQRFDPLLQRLALIGESELGALPMASLCDAPGERAVVATPRIKPRLPRKRPEASGMIFLAAPPTASLPMTQGRGPYKQPPFAATF